MWEANSASGLCVSSVNFSQFVLPLSELVVLETAGASNAGLLSESRGYFCTFVSGFNVYHEYCEWVPSAVWDFIQHCFIT